MVPSETPERRPQRASTSVKHPGPADPPSWVPRGDGVFRKQTA